MGVPDHFHLHLIPMHGSSDLDQNKAHQETDENMQKIKEKILSKL
jgi:diadenosine tetraphosphate (Ap4A) HIT family hydrolase